MSAAKTHQSSRRARGGPSPPPRVRRAPRPASGRASAARGAPLGSRAAPRHGRAGQGDRRIEARAPRAECERIEAERQTRSNRSERAERNERASTPNRRETNRTRVARARDTPKDSASFREIRETIGHVRRKCERLRSSPRRSKPKGKPNRKRTGSHEMCGKVGTTAPSTTIRLRPIGIATVRDSPIKSLRGRRVSVALHARGYGACDETLRTLNGPTESPSVVRLEQRQAERHGRPRGRVAKAKPIG